MKILFLNIFEGCHERDRYDKIIKFILHENPDVLGLSELNDWEKNDYARLKEFQKKTGMPHAAFCKAKSGFNLAILSKKDFNNETIVNKGFNTGFIKVDILFNNELISFILTHLHYKNEDLRIKELEIIQKHISKDEKTIFMGDMNSLSFLDGYDDSKLLEEMKKIGIKKFGKDKIRKDVIKKIVQLGFIDAVKESSRSFEYTTPTLFNKDIAHFTKLKLDYIFLNKKIADNLKGAKVIRNKTTNQLSDHFPLAAEINL